MGKRREYLKPGVRFRRQFWGTLNHVEQRQFLQQGSIPSYFLMGYFNKTLEEMYTPERISSLIFANNPFLTILGGSKYAPAKVSA
jgi:hypothetical protein